MVKQCHEFWLLNAAQEALIDIEDKQTTCINKEAQEKLESMREVILWRMDDILLIIL